MQTAFTAHASRLTSLCRSLPVFALLALLTAQVVPAQANTFAIGGLSDACFTYPAVAMTPQNDAIQDNRYLMTHERVYHQPESTDMILLFGPVHPWMNQFGEHVSFKVTFKDPDGPGTDAQVVGQFRFVDPQGIHILGTLDSNQHAQVTDRVQTMAMAIDRRKIERENGYYLVRLIIKRTTAELQPVAFGYNLCSTVVVE
jgi:hypothetical protein